jgi:hypothetical protein
MSATLLTRTAPPMEAVSSRATLWWARIVCLSAFGPYVAGSARTEQIVVFTSAALVLVFGWPQIVKARSYALAPVLVLWLALYAVMLIASLSRAPGAWWYAPQPASHALSFLALPAALILLAWYWTLTASHADLIRAVAPVIAGAMIVNTGIALAQLASGNVAVLSFLPRFWDSAPAAGSVAALAAENYRFTGIFDQPAEAGIAYGVALLCLAWLARRRVMRSGLLVTLCAAVLVTGGVLTVSKVFLLGALPLAVLTVLASRGRLRAGAWAAAAGAGAWALGAGGVLPAWPAGSWILRLAQPSATLAAQYSAGRYGSGGTLGPVVSDVLASSPVYGFGAGGLNVAYDSLWVEVLVVAGITGVLLLAAVVVAMAWRVMMLHAVLERPEWLLAAGVLILAAGASAGLPSLTANRAATLLWLVLGILVTAVAPSPRRG